MDETVRKLIEAIPKMSYKDKVNRISHFLWKVIKHSAEIPQEQVDPLLREALQMYDAYVKTFGYN